MVSICWLKCDKQCFCRTFQEGITGYSLSDDPNRKLMTARDALYLDTHGGAAVVGRTDMGSLEKGKCADFFAVNLDKLDFAGALQ